MKLLPPSGGTLVESELGQAFVRFYAGFVVLAAYLILSLSLASSDSLRAALACVLVYVGYSYCWVWFVAKSVGRTATRQRTALLLDHVVYATCFALGGPPVAVLAWVAVTTSVGHGLRFGERRGIAAAFVGAAAIFAAVELGPSWHLSLSMAAGLAATALVVPLYVVRLVRTMETQRREAELRAQALERAAHVDGLTNVLNRAGFNQTLRRLEDAAKTSGECIGLIYLDLDGFKAVNDTKGHDVGDLVLREVAQLLVGVVRNSDAVARLGGDEFALIIRNPANEAAVERVAEKATDAIRNWRHEAVGSAMLGASAGSALVRQGTSAEEALRVADMRMFAAKRSRQSNVRYGSTSGG